ncbi:MAG: SpoIIE family protein phosphatase, partial [Spirochaetes bacterium]|nr:SpoIIE family protein phosphatase [Spirochaetota bacterium]
MTDSKQKQKIELLKKQEVTLKSDFRKKHSLVFIISFLYLTLTLINLLIFWAAVGSRQMGLIKDKAKLTADSTAYSVVLRLGGIIANKTWYKQMVKNPDYAVRSLLSRFRKIKGSRKLILNNFKIIHLPEGRIIYNYPAGKNMHGVTDKKIIRGCISALRLKEQGISPFYKDVSILDYKMRIYVPIISSGLKDIVLISRLPIKEIKTEINNLIRLAVLMLIIMLAVQVIFGFLIYRILILPVMSLVTGARKVSEGDLDIQIKAGKSKNELGLLVSVFNNMVASLKEKTTKLEDTIKELEKNYEIIEIELEMAKVIQQSLMPKESITDRLIVSIYFAPLGKVSGDYYDMFELDDGLIGILITDACGHGIPAALVTMMAKLRFSGNAKNFDLPGDLLQKVNSQLAVDIPTPDYLTAFYLIIKPDLTMKYSNAAHQLCIIYRKNAGIIDQLDSKGFFIGSLEDLPYPYESAETKLEPGDRIILFTDGITEAHNPDNELYGEERLIKRIKEWSDLPVKELNEKIIKDVDTFANGAERKDDYSLIIFEISEKNIEAEKVMKKGILNLKNKKYSKAQVNFEKILTMQPHNLKAKLYLSYCYLFHHEYKIAIPLLKEYIQVYTTNDIAYLKLAICYEKTGDNKSALENYEIAIELGDSQVLAYTQSAILLAKKGDKERALSYFEEALSIKPGDKRLKQLKEKL